MSDDRFAQLFRASPVATWAVGADGQLWARNPAAEEFEARIGWATSLGEPLAERLAHTGLASALEERRSDRTRFRLGAIEVWGAVTFLAEGWQLVLTELQPADSRLEAELEATRVRLETVTACAPGGFWVRNLRSHDVWYSDRLLDSLGTGEPTLASWEARIHPDDRAHVLPALGAHAAGKGPLNVQVRLRGADGEFRWKRIEGQLRAGLDGEPEWSVGCNTDVHEVELAYSKLAASLRCADVAMWEWRAQDGSYRQDAIFFERIGLDPEPHTDSLWAGRLHDEDARACELQLKALIEGRSQRMRCEARLLDAAGKWRWCSTRGEVLERDEQGRPTVVVGIHVDIDAEKEVGQRLQLALGASDTLTWEWWLQSGRMKMEIPSPAGGYEVRSTTSDAILEAVEPEDRDSLTQSIRGAIKGTASRFDHEVRYRHKGRPRWVRISGVVAERDPEGRALRLLGQAIDVHERIDAIRKLASVEALSRRFVEHIPTPVAMFDREVRYLLASEGWARLVGGPRSELTGRSWKEAPGPGADVWIAHVERALAEGEEASSERQRVLGPVGEEWWIRWRLVPWRDDRGDIAGVVVVVEPIDEQVRYERSLEQARRVAEEAGSARMRFLARVSHEIRTPMNGVLGLTDILLSGPLEPAQREHAGTLKQVAQALMLVVGDMLDYSKVEAGELSLDVAPADIRHLLGHALEGLGAQARNKGIRLETRVEPDVQVALVDERRLEQLLVNLVGNAVKFTDEGRVEVAVSRDGRRLRFDIRDSGAGIGPEQLEHLFDEFAVGDESMARKQGGTGLGLAISRRLAHLMGGSIEVQSTRGLGSTFSLLIDGPEAGVEANPVAALAGGRILVVDDNRVNRVVAKKMLERLGYQTEVAEDGYEVLEWLDRGERFDAILMDVQMPRMDGLSATRRIRERGDPSGSVPIVALTAHAMESDRASCIEAGMDGYLTKPVNADRLQSMLQRMLRSSALGS